MAKSKFHDSWYVRKDRINLFIPFEKNLYSEISRVDGINLVKSTEEIYERVPDVSNSTNDMNSHYGLRFTGNDVVACDATLTSMLNQAFYGGNQTVTLAFWAYTEYNNDPPHPDDYIDVVEPNGNTVKRTYITNNAILADDRDEGYIFYTAGHTTTIAHADEYKNAGHTIDLDLWKKKIEATSTELVPSGSNVPFGQPLNIWALHVIVIKHGEGTNGPTSECSIHVLYNDTRIIVDSNNNTSIKADGQFNHYWTNTVAMDPSAVRNRANGPDGASNQWTIGGCLIRNKNGNIEDVPTYKYYYRGTLRNLMLYNVALNFDEIETLFKHGVDPYEATDINDTDVDSFDSNFWGKYGVIASNSDVKFEKCIIGDVVDSKDFPTTSESGISIASKFSTKNGSITYQNNSKFNIAGRDKSHLEVINRGNTRRNENGEVTSALPYEVSNPTTADRTYKVGLDYQGTDLLSVGVWRNSFATGNGKIKFITPSGNGYETVSKAIGGSFIEGGGDLIRISPLVNPETLPSGRYITEWTVSKPSNSNYPGYNPQTGLSSFLPNYYVRDRLGRSYKGYDAKTSISATVDSDNEASVTDPVDSKYVNGAFWNNTARYEKILWTRQRTFSSDITDNDFLDLKNGNVSDDHQRIDLCSAWEPVFWTKAIYEVNNEPTISNKGYFSSIRLTLIDETMSKSAIYYKLGRPKESNENSGIGNINIKYGDWQFDSFNTINNIMDKERLARIYLPHAYIPVFNIPTTHVNVTKASDSTSQYGLLATGDMILAKANIAFQYSKVNITGGNQLPSQSDYASLTNWSWPAYFKPIYTGWYEITWHWSWKTNDNNYTVHGYVSFSDDRTTIDVAGGLGDYVNRGSKGGGYGVLTLKAFAYITKDETVHINTDENSRSKVVWCTVRRISAGNVVTNVENITTINTHTTMDGITASYKGNDTNGYYYQVENIPVKYTRKVTAIIDNEPYVD